MTRLRIAHSRPKRISDLVVATFMAAIGSVATDGALRY
jgi:hypothetical protein